MSACPTGNSIDNPIGTVTINPSVSATSNTVFDMEIIGNQADKIVSTGAITLNGTLNLRITNLQAGDYIIMDGATLSGSFANILYSVNGSPLTNTLPSGLSILYNEGQGTITIHVAGNAPSTGNCLVLDGTNQYAKTLIGNGTLPTSFTIEAWVNFADPSTGHSASICQMGKSDGIFGIGFWFDNANTFGKGYNLLHLSFVNGKFHSYPFTPTANTWYHLAYVFNANTFQTTLFINGVSQGTQGEDGIMNTPLTRYGTGDYDIFFGRSIFPVNGSNLNLNGKIDEFRFWTIPRDAEQIRTNYQKEIADDSNLRNYYKFDDNAGSCGTLLTDCHNGNIARLFNNAHLVVTNVPITTDVPCGSTPYSCSFIGEANCNTEWSNPNNWSCGHAPVGGDDVFINDATVKIDNTASCSQLYLNGDNARLISPTGSSYPLSIGNMYWLRGAIESPITIRSGGTFFTSTTSPLTLASKITNHTTIGNLQTSQITFLTGAVFENQTDGELINPDFSGTGADAIFLDNYGKITYSTVAPFFVRRAALRNYGIINFQENNALFLYREGNVFGTNSTFNIGNGYSPSLFLAAPLEIQGNFNAKNTTVNMYSANASISGSGSLTIEKILSWGYGSISCPVNISSGASSQLFYNGSNLKLNSTFNNNGTTMLYQPKVDFNNGTFNNNNKLVVVYALSQFLNTTGTNTFNSCGLISPANNTEFQIKVGFPSCATSIISGNITVNSDQTVTISGTTSPGMSPGSIIINPSVIATSTAVFDMEIIGGYGAVGIEDDADKLESAGNIALNGTLKLHLNNPSAGSYTIFNSTGGTISGFSNLSVLYSVNGGAFTSTIPPKTMIQVNTSSIVVNIAGSVIPVELLNFQAKNTEGGNLLTWQTASEVNTSHFDIESSTDGKTFAKIGATKAQGKAASYNYLDKLPLSTPSTRDYYRLKINDLDGSYKYSEIISLGFGSQKLHVKVFPNPTRGSLSIDLGDTRNAKIRILNIFGQEVLHKVGQSGQILIDISNLPNGVYFAEISAQGVSIREKVIKN